MKLFITACLKEYQDDVIKIFRQANINVLSVTDVIGFKGNQSPNLLAEWFAAGDEEFDSLLFFSFTANENAEKGIELISKYNIETETNFPVRGFIVAVEKSSY
jgi:hypothetical protein